MTVLIKNVKIVGAARDFPESSDVFITDEKISAIGKFPNKRADEVLDGQGAYLSPGFIDVNTDSDHYLTFFDHPSQEDFLKQGVTTIFGGMCGSSLAPLIYGSLESVQKWGGSEDKINVNWHTMREFLATLEKRPLAVNFGTLVGHSTIRRAILGDALRDLTKNELAVFTKTLEQALDEGGFGLSTGLGYVHARKTPYAEIKVLAQIVKDAGGIYATHLRNTGTGIRESIDETIKIAKEVGVKTLVNHFVPTLGAKNEYEQALEAIEQLPQGLDFHFDIYPFETMILPLYTFLPPWVQTGGREIMLANVNDEWLVARIKKEIALDAMHFTIAQAPGNDALVGKSLKDVQYMYGLSDTADALIHLMRITKMKGVIFYKNLDGEMIRKAIVSTRAMIASNAPSFANTLREKQLKSERTTSTFTKFLSLVEERNFMSIQEAIKKITIVPAKTFGLPGRGEIKEGNFADLACFKNGEVKFTIVNGKVAMKNGEFQNTFSGKALKHS